MLLCIIIYRQRHAKFNLSALLYSIKFIIFIIMSFNYLYII